MTRGNDVRFTHGYSSIAEYMMADMAASRAKRDEGVTVAKVRAVIAAGRWRADVQARAWAGIAVAEALGLDPVVDRAKITATSSTATAAHQAADRNDLLPIDRPESAG